MHRTLPKNHQSAGEGRQDTLDEQRGQIIAVQHLLWMQPQQIVDLGLHSLDPADGVGRCGDGRTHDPGQRMIGVAESTVTGGQLSAGGGEAVLPFTLGHDSDATQRWGRRQFTRGGESRSLRPYG